MSDGRATVRPITLSRLVELTDACSDGPMTTEDVETALEVSHARARETILEAIRISLLSEKGPEDEPVFVTTDIGRSFLDAIRAENWAQVSQILVTRSPHYRAFIDAVDDLEHTNIETLLDKLEKENEFSLYTFNQTGIEVVSDWAERLGRVQRNAFTGSYYSARDSPIPSNFHFILLDIYDDLEQTAGVDLRQRYLSIPQLREACCERLGCRRGMFNEALLELCQQNIGKLELSGAPMDTAAKDSALGIKQISLADDGGLVSTSQSSQQVMAGVEQFGKQYYYLAVHDRDITFTQETSL